MNQFHWKGSQPANNKSAAAVNTPSASAGGDLSGIKIQPNQSYKAQIVPIPNQAASQAASQTANKTTSQNRAVSNSNQAGKPVAQIQISVPQPNGQTITLSQPLPALPQGITANQQFQVLLNITKGGELSITLSPDKQALTTKTAANTGASTAASTANQATINQTGGQTIKLSLSNSQIVDLLSLNKAFKNINNGQAAQTANQIQTTAKVIQQGNQAPQLKLPGSTGNIKLPDNIASLLQGQKTVSVSLKAQGRDITLQIDLAKTADAKSANSKSANAQLTTTITAEKLSPIIKQALNQSANQQVTITKQGSADKILLANQQTLSLGGKMPTLQQGDGQIKVSQLSAGQLTIQISNASKGDNQAANVKINIPTAQVSNNIKQALINSSAAQSQLTSTTDKTASPDGAKNLSANQTIENGKIVTTGKADAGATKDVGATKDASANQINQDAVNPINTAKTNPDLQIQKQALQQFIDPLIRLLLPKKQNWSEGFKTLAALEQSLKPDPKAANTINKSQAIKQQTAGQNSAVTTNNQNHIDLKQLINQVKEAIPDHTANLDDKTITTMISEILNFSPTKTATPNVQPTPANAIASALQLLLGAKLSQGEAKLSNQLQQQLQQLIKPMAPKAPATEAGVKNAMQGLTNLDQATGSLKALTGIQSTMRHQQVENVEKRLDGNSQLEFSFPLRVDNQVKELHIAINEEKHKSETSSSRLSIWNLNLTFDLNDFGKLLVNAKLKDGEVSMHMYAEQPKTLSLMKQFSATLEQRLEFHGVKINNIQSSLGKISSTNSKRQLNSLVQIKV